MKKNSHNPTMMIKSKFSNEIHKLLHPCYGIKPHTQEYHKCLMDRKNNPLTDKQKAEIFDKIAELHNKTSWELTFYFIKRKLRNKINKLRMEKGLTIKNETSLDPK